MWRGEKGKIYRQITPQIEICGEVEKGENNFPSLFLQLNRLRKIDLFSQMLSISGKMVFLE
ncbi:MAG: hypothetical protein C6I01_06110 [Epsilonproteobacteria bacterium]|nr:hypothetical protein [Campylobacterota bacterium]